MTRLADPRRCPDCRSDLPQTLACPACRLDLRGERGMRLFALLSEADALMDAMRSAPVTTPTTATASAPPNAVAPLVPAGAEAPRPSSRRPTASRGVRLDTVPKVLLALGALCVLVAASLFLPFAWEMLGVTGRTVVLILLTAAAGALAEAAGRRGLRPTAEALGLVALGLLAFDVVGARTSGWFGDISDGAFVLVVGAVLTVAATGATLRLRRTAASAFVGGEGVAVTGSVLLAAGTLSLGVGTVEQRLALLVPLLALLTAGSAGLRGVRQGVDSMVVAAVGHGLVTAMVWLALLVWGLVGLTDGLTWSALWAGGSGPTLLLAAAYCAAPALLRTVPSPVRVTSLALAMVPAVVAVTAPAYDEGHDVVTVGALLLLPLCLAALRFVAPPWNASVLPTGGLSAGVALVLVAPHAAEALSIYGLVVGQAWGGGPAGRAAAGAAAPGSPWLLPLVCAAVSLTLLLAVRRVAGDEGVRILHAPAVAAGTLTLLACSGSLMVVGSPVWTVLTLLLLGTTCAGAAAWVTGRADWQAAQVTLGGLALLLSWYDEWLTLAACSVLLALALVHHAQGPAAVRAGAGLVTAPLLTGGLWSGGAVLGASWVWTALVVVLVLSALLVGRGLLDDPTGVVGVELGVAVASTAAILVGTDAAPESAAPAWLAVYLTVAGAAATVVALTREDRRPLGWAGGLLLAAASWVRLADLGVATPEAYTLPSALALLLVGRWRTRHDSATGTLTAWSPGLALALAPTLLWAMADPLSGRALLLGVSCLALTLLGAQLRLAAPFLWGAAVGATLVLWEVLPQAFAMSSWLVIGAAGAALLIVGASWDRRVHEARVALGYVRALR